MCSTHSPPADDTASGSPQGYSKNVKHRELKGKGREAKGNSLGYFNSPWIEILYARLK